MNKEIFKAIMKPALETNTTRDGNQFAELLSKAYELSTVGFAKTIYGGPLVKGHTAFLKDSIASAINANQSDTTGTTKTVAYKLMAVGFCGYWAGATILPLPAFAPITVPIKGPKILFPGSPEPLATDLLIAFSQGYTDNFLSTLCAVLVKFQTTIAGTYDGTIPGSPPVPAVLPWTGII